MPSANNPALLPRSTNSKADDPDELGLEGPPEPDPFTPDQFGAWRGMLRVHTTVFRELDRKLIAEHGFGVDAYGVLITLVTATAGALPIGELGAQRNLSPSGVSRSVDRLVKMGLVKRTPNPADARSQLVGLTSPGITRLRAAQVTHHAIVRELFLDRFEESDVKRLCALWETAMPGSVSSQTWPRQAGPNPVSEVDQRSR